MVSKLITNQDQLLKDVLLKIFPSTENLYFLVGYFYFSGFEQIFEHIQDKSLKILVGMEIERDLQNKIKEFEYIQNVNLSRGKIKGNFYDSLIQLFNESDFFDRTERQKAFRFYLEKIENGTLEIKKTCQPVHAKMYLLENKDGYNQGGVYPGTLITGSSNLSSSGLKDRLEINVILRDNHDYLEGKKIFDHLWSTAIKIVDQSNIDEFSYSVVEKIWINKLPKPFLMYLRVLDELFAKKAEKKLKYPSEITKDKFFDLKYQTDAIQMAMTIMEKHGGVIISDVVGLGKSIIASSVAYNLGLKTIIITPPHLKDQWEEYRWTFDYNAKIYSSGTIENALLENKDLEEKLIIIDEAHKYRNENTNNYAKLHQLCQGNKVILLTATPFNNRPQDIFSMIKFFQIPAKSSIQTAENLTMVFKGLIADYKNIEKIQKEQKASPEAIKQKIRSLANQIRDILFPVLIRRTRLDLMAIDEYKEDLVAQGVEFPRVADPVNLEYDLGEMSALYLNTLRRISPDDEEKGFIGARYKPVFYLKNIEKYKSQIKEEFGDEKLFVQSQVNVARFMRRLLVHRFESSIYSFMKSLEYMIQSSENVLNWYERAGMVPIYKKGYIPDVESLLEDIEGEFLSNELAEQVFENNIENLKRKGYQFIKSHELKIAFKNEIMKDIELLKSIQQEWLFRPKKNDPKLDFFYTTLREKIKNEPKRKIAVYTVYADTAQYLYDQLKDKLRVFKYSSADSSKENKRIIKQNFDAGIPDQEQRNDYDILIATDAISEGYNLHRAGAIVNYDIPYNPTRVIQRVGRINRVNKKVFEELFIYNFFPTDIGEQETGIKRISTLKKAVIDALLGEDTRILTDAEELESFFIERFRKEWRNQEELSWDAPYRQQLGLIKKSTPELLEKAKEIPKRVRIQRSAKKDIKGVLVFGKKADNAIFKLGINSRDSILVPPSEALAFFEAEITEEAKLVGPNFELLYQHVMQSLFIKKSQIPYSKGRADAVNKITLMKEKLPAHQDYLEDLKQVIEKLDGLPEIFLFQIRSISFKTMDTNLAQLIEAVPHSYLMQILEKAKNIEEGKETLILSEEFI